MIQTGINKKLPKKFPTWWCSVSCCSDRDLTWKPLSTQSIPMQRWNCRAIKVQFPTERFGGAVIASWQKTTWIFTSNYFACPVPAIVVCWIYPATLLLQVCAGRFWWHGAKCEGNADNPMLWCVLMSCEWAAMRRRLKQCRLTNFTGPKLFLCYLCLKTHALGFIHRAEPRLPRRVSISKCCIWPNTKWSHYGKHLPSNMSCTACCYSSSVLVKTSVVLLK